MTAIAQTTVASSVQAVSGSVNIGALPGEQMELLVYVDVTAVAGTSPSLTITYRCSPDGVNFWDHTVGVAITAVGKQLIKIPGNLGKFGQLSYAIAGVAPSFTFSMVAEAKRL